VRRVVVSGGPSPRDVRVRDSETGADLSFTLVADFLSFTLVADGNKLTTIKLNAFAEAEDVVAEDESCA